MTCTLMPWLARGGVMAVVAAAALAGASAAAAAPPAAGVISTVAGNVGGPAKATNVAVPACGVAYAGGAVRIADGSTIRAVNAQTDFLTTPAGNNTAGGGAQALPGDGGPATSGGLSSACGVALDQHGNLAIADSNDERIRVVAHSTGTFFGQAMTAGDIYTVAGTGALGFSGDGGPGTAAELFVPHAVVVDRAGNLVITDSGNNRVRVVAAKTGWFYGQRMTTGDIYTIAGTGIQGFSGDGGSATKAQLDSPEGLTFDHFGNLLIADTYNNRVRVVAAKSGTFYGQAMTARHIYTVAGGGTGGLGNGGPATSAFMDQPRGIAVDGAGNLLIADSADDMVRAVAASTGTFYGQAMTAGDIYTIAGNGVGVFSGDGGPATAAGVGSPAGVALDGSGNVLIASQGNARVRVVAAGTGTFYGKAMTTGDIYTIAGNGKRAFSGEGGPAVKAQLYIPGGVALDGAGNLVVADTGNNRIRVSVAGTGTFYGQAMTAGDIYTIAGNGTGGFSGDGGPAAAAELSHPQAVAVDGAGNVLVADSGNNRIRVVAARTGTFYGRAMTAGDIYTIAGNGTGGFSGDGGPATAAALSQSFGVAVDGAGNVLVADSGNNRIRVVAAATGTFYGKAMAAGDIYTIAGNGTAGFGGDGGPATAARLDFPFGMTVDGSGNVVIADGFNDRVRVVAAGTGTFYGTAMAAGDIYTIAGTGAQGFSGDGGPATAAKLYGPEGPVLDGAGNLIFADSGNNRVRVVAASTGTFYGKAMTVGDIYTVAGNGAMGFSGDGGPATAATLAGPTAIAVDGGGNLLIADAANNRVREVTG
jgi:trimeric autotransporter adhesin